MLKMTQLNDAFVGRLIFQQIRFIGTGLTIGELFRLVDTNGSLITEHYVVLVTEDFPILTTGSNNVANGAKITSMPSGTAEVQIHLM
jgi:hypothetical protein